MPLLRYLQLRGEVRLVVVEPEQALLRQQLFEHRDAWKWLDEPFAPPAGLPETALKLLALPLAPRA